jgi:LytS/YehU family sensor histidine kinase
LKHGVISDSKPIEVTLLLHKNNLKFTVKNEISKLKKDQVGGVGLDNLKKRLSIYYPQKHKLSLTDENNIFIADLEIQLK